MELFDTHTHLTDPRYEAILDELLERAALHAVKLMVTIGCDLADSRAAIALAQRYEQVYATVGIHAHESGKAPTDAIPLLRQLAQQPKVVAVGEIGLDYHYDFSDRPAQQHMFAAQIELACELGMPIVVHCREAFDDCLSILLEAGAENHPVVFHCFGGDAAQARIVADHGWLVAFAGTVTFKKAEAIQQAAQILPLDRILVETDCPYLSPAPKRNVKPNEPALLGYTVAKIAELRGATEQEIAQASTANGRSFFGIA